MSAKQDETTYRMRWTTKIDIFVTVTGASEDEAYDEAVRRVEGRLDQLGVPMSDGVTISGSIDGMEADEVKEVTGG